MALAKLPPIERLHLADVTLPPAHPSGGGPCPVYAFLIRHPQGAILVDTGVGARHDGIERLYHPVRHPLAGALDAVGLRPSDIVAVINTHLHFDHCGENRLFEGIPIFVHAMEYEAAQQYAYTVEEWVDFPGASFEFVEDEPQVLPGVYLLATPGHTPGHQSVLIESDEGRAIVAGQAAYTAAEFDTAPGEWQKGQWDEAQYAASLARLRDLSPRRVYLSHDANTWEARAETRDRA